VRPTHGIRQPEGRRPESEIGNPARRRGQRLTPEGTPGVGR
jgi:hypothetical protein